jgi:hypothetical protein
MTRKKFVNPLLHSSESDLHLSDQATPENPIEHSPTPVKKKAESFEDRHERFTGWVDKDLKRQFNELVKAKGPNKTALLNEAITLLLHKENRKPYTRKNSAE